MTHTHFSRLSVLTIIVAACFALVACSSLPKGEAEYPDWDSRVKNGRITGDDGLVLFGGKDKKSSDQPTIGVNGFLWRASLDTTSFLPLASADPFGGVIISDWYSPPETPNERVKITVYILSQELRSDGVRVAIFRQVKNAKGDWVDQKSNPETATTLENKILTRARQLRVESAALR